MTRKTSGQGSQRGRTPGPVSGTDHLQRNGARPIASKGKKPKKTPWVSEFKSTEEWFRQWRQDNAVPVIAYSKGAHVGPVSGPCHLGWSCFSWPIFWKLTTKAPMFGYIIQEIVTSVMDDSEKGSHVVKHFYEAWPVKEGHRRTAAIKVNKADEYDDLWARPFFLTKSNGGYLMRGIAKFYPGPLPKTFKIPKNGPSDLLTTKVRPDFFDGTGLVRKAFVKWNLPADKLNDAGTDDETLESLWECIRDASSTSKMRIINGKKDRMVPLFADKAKWKVLGLDLWKTLVGTA